MESLEVIRPRVETVTLSDGRTVDVRPVRMGQLPDFIEAATPIIDAIGAQPQDASELVLFAAVAKNTRALNAVLRITTGLTDDEIAALEMDDGFALGLGVFRVNKAVFLERLLPMLGKALAPNAPPAGK